MGGCARSRSILVKKTYNYSTVNGKVRGSSEGPRFTLMDNPFRSSSPQHLHHLTLQFSRNSPSGHRTACCNGCRLKYQNSGRARPCSPHCGCNRYWLWIFFSKLAHLTISTGQRQFRETLPLKLPKMILLLMLTPLLPMTVKSKFSSSAFSQWCHLPLLDESGQTLTYAIGVHFRLLSISPRLGGSHDTWPGCSPEKNAN